MFLGNNLSVFAVLTMTNQDTSEKFNINQQKRKKFCLSFLVSSLIMFFLITHFLQNIKQKHTNSVKKM